MNLDELTFGQIKQLKCLLLPSEPQESQTICDSPWEVGENYLVRTVTMAISGKLKSVGQQELVFSEAAWIADTGRFSEALEDQDKFNEVEPFKNDVIVGRGSIVDATKIVKLIRKMK